MQIDQERNEGKLTLKIKGRLETITSIDFRRVVENNHEGIIELYVDLKELEYISSSGFRELLSASKKMKRKGGSMTIYNVNDEVMELFEITGFKEILNIR